ncbi:MAG: TIGR02186 family protein [Pseudomonadota bacterium]
MIRALLIACLMASPVAAEEVVGALSQDRVSITANFDGSEISIYGAVKREAPIPQDAGPLQVLITIEGPSEPITVRRKEKRLGIWVNTDAVVVDRAPSFYAIATTAPLPQVMSETERLRHNIGFDKVVRLVGAPAEVANPESFPEAVVRIRRDNGLYAQLDNSIDLREETLFITSVALPANLVEGSYRARMFLTRDRDVVSMHETEILVAKAGMEKWIYDLAHKQPFVYGILSIAVALFAGWAASEAFRLLRR